MKNNPQFSTKQNNSKRIFESNTQILTIFCINSFINGFPVVTVNFYKAVSKNTKHISKSIFWRLVQLLVGIFWDFYVI